MLIQLESGDWIDPIRIVGCSALEESISSLDGKTIPPRVQVRIQESGFIQYKIVEFNTIEGARDYRDAIARMANESQLERLI
jgi:hypothetical protein